mmetsp:Transcript_13301/g.38800  ORF Transcript_13301/g.38800 Transcript_13301/m.38800 type:complete len:217 (+) Transcript_13301:566-1216(+)
MCARPGAQAGAPKSMGQTASMTFSRSSPPGPSSTCRAFAYFSFEDLLIRSRVTAHCAPSLTHITSGHGRPASRVQVPLKKIAAVASGSTPRLFMLASLLMILLASPTWPSCTEYSWKRPVMGTSPFSAPLERNSRSYGFSVLRTARRTASTVSAQWRKGQAWRKTVTGGSLSQLSTMYRRAPSSGRPRPSCSSLLWSISRRFARGRGSSWSRPRRL